MSESNSKIFSLKDHLVRVCVKYGGRDKVEIYKVDKLFWLMFLGRNWLSHFVSTENEYSV